jgi:hypothetical protein
VGRAPDLKKEDLPVFFNRNSTNRRVTELESKLDKLTRDFQSLLQEWDATALRVTKTLRRLREWEQRREQEMGEETPVVGQIPPNLPLTTLSPSSDRMGRIRRQLADRGRAGGLQVEKEG